MSPKIDQALSGFSMISLYYYLFCLPLTDLFLRAWMYGLNFDLQM